MMLSIFKAAVQESFRDDHRHCSQYLEHNAGRFSNACDRRTRGPGQPREKVSTCHAHLSHGSPHQGSTHRNQVTAMFLLLFPLE